MTHTVDANVLLYASDETNPYHRDAREAVERVAQGPEIVYLFWPTLIAYLRIATHPAVFSRPLAADEAIGNVETLIAQPHIRTPGEPEGFWARYRAVTDDATATGNLVSDAHIVALMLAHEVRIIWTHDRDYRRFRTIEVHDPFA